MSLAALFIAQVVGIQLSLGDQMLLLRLAMLSSKGSAGVTGAGIGNAVAIIVISSWEGAHDRERFAAALNGEPAPILASAKDPDPD